MGYIPDYNDMIDSYLDKQEREFKKLPKCYICGRPIQDEYAFLVDGDYYHEDCMKEEFRVDMSEWEDE